MALIVNIRKKLHQFTLKADFEIDSSLALLGASGSGKSMTLKCIAGIEKPDEGVIILDGRTLYDSKKKINLPPQKRNVGYLFQNYALFPNMTVRENIAVAAKGGESSTDRLISDFYLDGLQNKYPHEISGGQQQRTALARIIASCPEAILLDEPFSAIDSHMRWKLELTVSDIIKNFGGMSIMVTHNKNEAYRNCRSICIINDGRTEDILNTEEFIDNPKTVGAAGISGCKNIYAFERKTGNSQVFVPGINISLKTARTVDDGKKYIGIRAHCFSFEPGENKIDGVIERVIEDVFSTIIMLRPINSEAWSEPVRIEADKKTAAEVIAGKYLSVYIDPKDILLLE